MRKFRLKQNEVFASQFMWGLETGVIRDNSKIYRNANLYPESEGIESTKHKGYLAKYDSLLDEKGFGAGRYEPFFQVITGHIVILQDNNTHYIVRDNPKSDFVDGIYYKEDFEKKYEEVI